ncbi:hypothetical protein DZG03_15525, partial [Clavibacter phaseoli]
MVTAPILPQATGASMRLGNTDGLPRATGASMRLGNTDGLPQATGASMRLGNTHGQLATRIDLDSADDAADLDLTVTHVADG